MQRFFCFVFLLLPLSLGAQQSTQTIRGTEKDKLTQQAIVGTTVTLADADFKLGALTDGAGNFEIKDVPLGRRTIVCSYIGYKKYVSEGVLIRSTKSVFLEINLSEGALELDEVIISVGNKVNQPVNELLVVSTRSFSADETDRIAASVNDPGRLALAYPDVAQGGDDNENDIIIRGNSPFGMLWRLEGIDIPNPNHFARPGTFVGEITIFT